MTAWLHPLHKYLFTEEDYKIIKERNPYLRGRRTGKSTLLAFDLISLCMKHPGVHIEIIDHHGAYSANLTLFYLVENIISKLDLKGFEFKRDKNKLFMRFE